MLRFLTSYYEFIEQPQMTTVNSVQSMHLKIDHYHVIRTNVHILKLPLSGYTKYLTNKFGQTSLKALDFF